MASGINRLLGMFRSEYECTTSTKVTIALMINANVKRNPNPNPNLNAYPTSNQNPNNYPHSNSSSQLSSQKNKKQNVTQIFFTLPLSLNLQLNSGNFHMRTNHIPKDVSERDSALSWFESLILALVNQKLFKSGFWNAEKRAFWIMIRIESLILGHVNAKFFRNVIRVCVHFGNARWSHAWVIQHWLRSGNKYYLAVRRSWSWLGRRLQCMWTHVVQITRSKTSFGTWFVLMWTGPVYKGIFFLQSLHYC